MNVHTFSDALQMHSFGHFHHREGSRADSLPNSFLAADPVRMGTTWDCEYSDPSLRLPPSAPCLLRGCEAAEGTSIASQLASFVIYYGVVVLVQYISLTHG